MYRPYAADLKETAYCAADYTIQVPGGVHIDDIMKPAWWAYLAGLKAGDKVTIYALDGSLDVELRVLWVGNTGPKLRVLREYADDVIMGRIAARRTPADEPAKPPYVTKLAGPLKWVVVRTDTGDRVAEKIATREEAEEKVAELTAAYGQAVVA